MGAVGSVLTDASGHVQVVPARSQHKLAVLGDLKDYDKILQVLYYYIVNVLCYIVNVLYYYLC